VFGMGVRVPTQVIGSLVRKKSGPYWTWLMTRISDCHNGPLVNSLLWAAETLLPIPHPHQVGVGGGGGEY